ncbi:hypothetical protein DYH09_28585 [bacterium CPR1]|nr:hypothetical protein [bacterium CPR1]
MSKLSPRILEQIEREVRKLALEHQLELVRIDYQQQDIGWCLSIIVNRQGGVRVQDCERLHRPLSRRLDELDLIRHRYFLEVSSPGVPSEKPASESTP